MSDIERARQLLSCGNTCVLVRGSTVYASSLSGIRPMMQHISLKVDLSGFSAADKVVGKAAAMLFALSGITQVYAEVLSKEGLKTLTEFNIECTYSVLTEAILNRAGTSLCPMEQAVKDINNPLKAYKVLESKLKGD